MEDEFYTPDEVAALLKVTRQAVYNWVARGRLKAVKAERVTRIRRVDLETFLQPIEPEEQTKAAA